MLSRSVHNAVTIILSLSVAWHSIAGCCAHHPHSQTACGEPACGEALGPLDPHSLCDHRCELEPLGLGLSRLDANDDVDANDDAIAFKGNPTQDSCLGGKCAFVTGEKSTKIAPPEGASPELDWSFADLFGDSSLLTFKRLAQSRPPSLIGATSARPQQLLCAWLI